MHYHLIGIGGIGMSGLAQLLLNQGNRVSGSDRDSGKKENEALFAALNRQGIAIYPQDGSFLQDGTPDFLVYSTAIEEDNADFIAAGAIPRLHRSQALADALNALDGAAKIAVSGSCGKTSVTAMLAEAMCRLGLDCGCLDGGMVKAFRDQTYIGNFHPGKEFFCFEADESDKSLLNFNPDFSLVLNIGTDHYSKDELSRVFSEFLQRTNTGAVIAQSVLSLLPEKPRHIEYHIFEDTLCPNGPADKNVHHWVSDYYVRAGRAFAVFDGKTSIPLPQGGFHTALNVLASAMLLEFLNIPFDLALSSVAEFSGVGRRFDYIGSTSSGAVVYDDYAHNPEKLQSVILAAQELAGNEHRVLAVFQPHGYKPLGFMREALYEVLKLVLRKQDYFFLLEPFYAGGSSSFSPHADEVAADYHKRNLSNVGTGSRAEAAGLLQSISSHGDVILILGARDNSLPLWAAELCQK